MAITIGTASTGVSTTTTDTLTISHTIGASDDLLVFAFGLASNAGTGTGDVTGVTFDGVAATKAISAISSSHTSGIWYMLATDLPSAGTYDAVYTFNVTMVSGRLTGAVESLQGAKQEAPEATSSTTLTSSATSISDTITTITDGAFILTNLVTRSGALATPDSPHIKDYSIETGTTAHWASGAHYEKPTAGSDTPNWTFASQDRRALVTIACAPAAGATSNKYTGSLGMMGIGA